MMRMTVARFVHAHAICLTLGVPSLSYAQTDSSWKVEQARLDSVTAAAGREVGAGRSHDARAILQRAVEHARNKASREVLHSTIGDTYFFDGRYANARAAYERALVSAESLRADSVKPGIYRKLAIVESLQGNRRAAHAHFSRELALARARHEEDSADSALAMVMLGHPLAAARLLDALVALSIDTASVDRRHYLYAMQAHNFAASGRCPSAIAALKLLPYQKRPVVWAV